MEWKPGGAIVCGDIDNIRLSVDVLTSFCHESHADLAYTVNHAAQHTVHCTLAHRQHEKLIA